MRELTSKQKKLLLKWIKEDNHVRRVKDISLEQWEILEAINDTEILYQNVSIFLDEHASD